MEHNDLDLGENPIREPGPTLHRETEEEPDKETQVEQVGVAPKEREKEAE